MLLIQEWLEVQLPGSSPIETASADASFRRYFRTECDGTSFIIMDAPPDREDSHPFVHVARWMEAQQLPAPRVLTCDFDQGLMLLDDLGRDTLLDHLKQNDDPTALYRDAIDLLIRLQVADARDPLALPAYDEVLLRREMDLFRDWYACKLVGVEFGDADEQRFEGIQQKLLVAVGSQPRGLVHRDYHSRNLMLNSDGRLAMLDFQDAVRGPLSYDLISLLRDSYFRLGPERETDLREYYRQQAVVAELLPVTTSGECWTRDCALMAMQRHLKVVGIFARLWLRDGKRQYLGDIPLTRDYLRELCSYLSGSEGAWLQGWLSHPLPAEVG